MVDFRAVIDSLVDIGFYSVFLPFILVYAIIFAILEKSKIFTTGDDKQSKNVNAVVAFVFGLFVVASLQAVKYIESLIVNVVVFVIFILCILIVLGLIFGEGYMDLLKHKYVKWTIFAAVIITVLIVAANIFGFWDWLEDVFGDFGDSDTITGILVFLGIAGVLYWITSSDEKTSSTK